MKKLIALVVVCLFFLGACEYPTKTTVEGYVKEGQDNQLKHHEGMLDAFKAAHPEAAEDFTKLGNMFTQYMINSTGRIEAISAENETLAGELAKIPGITTILGMLGITGAVSTVASRKISPSGKAIAISDEAIAILNEEVTALTLALAKKAPKDEEIPG